MSYPKKKNCFKNPHYLQSGIFNPCFRFRFTSMSPHLSSHSLFSLGSLNLIFHGSSKAENLGRLDMCGPKKGGGGGVYQKYSVPRAFSWHTKSDMNKFISSIPATLPLSLPPPLGQPTSLIMTLGNGVRPMVVETSVAIK